MSVYRVELSNNSNASCKNMKCKGKIMKGELRIGMTYLNSYYGGLCTDWHHPYCFSQKHKNLGDLELDGFEALPKEKKEIISSLLKKKEKKIETEVEEKKAWKISDDMKIFIPRDILAYLQRTDFYQEWNFFEASEEEKTGLESFFAFLYNGIENETLKANYTLEYFIEEMECLSWSFM